MLVNASSVDTHSIFENIGTREILSYPKGLHFYYILPESIYGFASHTCAKRVTQHPTYPSVRAPQLQPHNGNARSQQRVSPNDVEMSSPMAARTPEPQTENNPPAQEQEQENASSPGKQRHSRILSGNGIAPLRILSPREDKFASECGLAPMAIDSVAKSPLRRFPVKVNTGFPVRANSGSSSNSPPQDSPAAKSAQQETTPQDSPAAKPTQTDATPRDSPTPRSSSNGSVVKQEMTFEEALASNDGLKHAIQIFEDDSTMLESGEGLDDADVTSMTVDDHHLDKIDEAAAPDESMVSTFSNFSVIPNLTTFAKMGTSPNKFDSLTTPRPRNRYDPSTARSARRSDTENVGDTTSLLDFTEQMSAISEHYRPSSPTKRGRSRSPAKTNGHANATPKRGDVNLLDFDIPPMPTPRSVPTVTPQAEVTSLKTAVGDAEKRVGQTMEKLREAECLTESVTEEKESWEKRGREMESVLRKVKSEIVHNQHERDELESKLDESEKRREAAEMMAQEAESKIASLRAGRSTPDVKSPDRSDSRVAAQREAENMERVARELHALYKSKHETKVTALKKSYEARWEKKIRELERQIEELTDDNERLKVGRDATMTRVEFGQAVANETAELKAQSSRDAAQIKELGAEVQKLEAIVSSVKQDNHELIVLLERERVEKGELVQLAEEMMEMQHSFVAANQAKAEPKPEPKVEEEVRRTPVKQARMSAPVPPPTSRTPVKQTPARSNSTRSVGASPAQKQAFRSSLTRPGPTGIRAPGSALPKSQTESRIGGLGNHASTRSMGGGGLPRPGSGLSRPGSGLSGRSGIMSSIEKMGNYRTRGD
ncbi:hypothetical protein PG993_004697 [Apiospora rasikravindrae]|uniref:Uncharacterized protein n=1 Tax=Apiospora rasikravindrae TaxID=990691 RepID=A0ABR1TG91_9PEZI